MSQVIVYFPKEGTEKNDTRRNVVLAVPEFTDMGLMDVAKIVEGTLNPVIGTYSFCVTRVYFCLFYFYLHDAFKVICATVCQVGQPLRWGAKLALLGATSLLLVLC